MKNIYKDRRESLLNKIREEYANIDCGVVLLFANFENDKTVFRQESSFYYLTGIKEPGVVFCLHLDGKEELFVPDYGGKRAQWVEQTLECEKSIKIKKLGKINNSFYLKPFFCKQDYENLINSLKEYLCKNRTIFSLVDKSNDNYFTAFYRLEKLTSFLSFEASVQDISKIVAKMRRQKDEHELSLLKKAAQITLKAHEQVFKIIKPGLYEYEIQAEIEKVFTQNNAKIAFPSIIASGKNTTVLHYISRNQKLKSGDLLVVDIGAEVNYYCADITRTYPVSGKFSERQKQIYNIVSELQQYIASIAKPGMFLRNKLSPEESLHHIAEKFLENKNLLKYFSHGIGHFLGLNVHDVGDIAEPIEIGDVFTIEPGIYIEEENIGVRIEDDFVMGKNGIICYTKK